MTRLVCVADYQRFPCPTIQNFPSRICETAFSTAYVSALMRAQVTPAVRWPVVSGQMIGTRVTDTFLDARGCRPGDAVLMYGWAGLEGTAVIAQVRA
jgi:hypothetical protein